jgi:hypothetical protein
VCLNQTPERLGLAVTLADVIIVNVLEQNIYTFDDFESLLKQILKTHTMAYQK